MTPPQGQTVPARAAVAAGLPGDRRRRDALVESEPLPGPRDLPRDPEGRLPADPDLAAHVAKVGLRRSPAPAVPASLQSIIAEMAGVADKIAAKISAVLASPDAVDAATLGPDDDEMDS